MNFGLFIAGECSGDTLKGNCLWYNIFLTR